MNRGRTPRFGIGLGIGIVLGLLLGSLLVARLGVEAAEAARSVTDRMLGRRERLRFEALLQ